jgi:hypothetical protein
MRRLLNPNIINTGRNETTAAFTKHALSSLVERNAWTSEKDNFSFKSKMYDEAEKKASQFSDTKEFWQSKYSQKNVPANTRLFPENLLDTREFERDYNFNKSQKEKDDGLSTPHTIKSGLAQKPGPNPNAPFKYFKTELQNGTKTVHKSIQVTMLEKTVPHIPIYDNPKYATPEELNRTFGLNHGFKTGDKVYLIHHIEQ